MEWLSGLIQLGGLAVVSVALIFVVWQMGNRYAKVIEDNTKAMTEVSEVNRGLKDTIANQTKVIERQGDMLTQIQNFLMQICIERKVSKVG